MLATLDGNAARFRATQTPEGGLKRADLSRVLRSLLDLAVSGPGKDTFSRTELDLVVPELRIGLAVQAGRAWTNNGALLSVLAAASDTAVEWLLIMTPFTYKNSAAFPNVELQVRALAEAEGVDLDLHGVGLVAY